MEIQMENKYICIDIGGTSIKYCIADEAANMSKTNRIKTPESIDGFWDWIEKIIEWGKSETQERISGIAISLPGRVDAQKGYVYTGGCLTYLHDFAFVELLEQKFKLPATIENDGVCAAAAELYGGALKGCREAAAIVFGTGIGGALIIDGKIRKGVHFNTAEFSSIIMGAGFYLEETLWAADNGDYHLRQLAAEVKRLPVEQLDGRKIFDLAESGDQAILEMLRCYTKIIARNIYNIQAILDLEKIVIGGGISVRPLFINMIIENLNDYASCVDAPVIMPAIAPCFFGQDANLVGALRLHLK